MEINFDKIENSEALIKISLKDVDYQPQVTEKSKILAKKQILRVSGLEKSLLAS